MGSDAGRLSEHEDFFDDEDGDAQKDKHLLFTLGREEYGIEIYHVTEIVGMQRITAMPDMPAHIRGVVNLRGRVLPVMDVRLRFGMPERAYDERTCIVVVSVAGGAVGLVVDAVTEVADIPESQIELPPGVAAAGAQRCIKGLGKVGDSVKILLDAGKLVSRDPAVSLQHAAIRQAGAPAVAYTGVI